MAATNALLAFGGMTHCWRRWGLRVFFERSPDRAVAGTIDNAEFYDLVLQQPQRPARPSLRRFGTSQGDQLGLFLAVENARHRRCRALFAGSKPPRTLLPPVACAPGRPWMGWHPGPR